MGLMNRHRSGQSQSVPDGLMGTAPRGPVPSDWSPQAIHVEIDELVLHGFRPRDRFAIAEAVTRELDGLLRERALPPALLGGGDLARLDGGSFAIAPGSRAETIGRQIAHVVYEGWAGRG